MKSDRRGLINEEYYQVYAKFFILNGFCFGGEYLGYNLNSFQWCCKSFLFFLTTLSRSIRWKNILVLRKWKWD